MYQAFVVREQVEGGLAMIASHATVAHASEGQLGLPNCSMQWLMQPPPKAMRSVK